MKHISLKEVLLTNDLGEKYADEICDQVLNNTFNGEDNITAIIVNAFWDGSQRRDLDDIHTDLCYAVHQLEKAKYAIYKAMKD